jgi:hypothetical protein
MYPALVEQCSEWLAGNHYFMVLASLTDKMEIRYLFIEISKGICKEPQK